MSDILDIQFYQYMHDRKYHHDINVMKTFNKISHLQHHLIKYSNGNKKDDYYSDTFACLLSMADTINCSMVKELNKLEIPTPTGTFNDIIPIYADNYLDNKFDVEIKNISKLIEGYDHAEGLSYKPELAKAITTLVIILFQQFKRDTGNTADDLIKGYMKRLEVIKGYNIFHKYFLIEDNNHPTYKKLRDLYL